MGSLLDQIVFRYRYPMLIEMTLEDLAETVFKTLLRKFSRSSQALMSLQKQGIYQFGTYFLDREELTLSRDGEPVLLPPKLFELLSVLVVKRGTTVSKEELLGAVWPDTFVEESNLTQSIFTLRRRLGKTEAGEDYIQNVPRRGYRISVPVTEVAAARGAIRSEDQASPAEEIFAGAIPVAVSTPGQAVRGWSVLLWVVPVFVLVAAAIFTTILLRLASGPAVDLRYAQLTRDGMDKRGMAHTRGGPSAALVTDGARIYFTEGSSGGTRLAQVSVTGGETATIPVPFTMTQLLDYSAARSELLVGGSAGHLSGQRLWAVSVPSGTSHPIGDIVATDAAWSPSGSELAFTRGTALYRSSPDGSHVSQITTLPGNPYRPRWSPDAHTLRFTLLDPRTKEQSLWEVGVDGSNLHPLLPDWNSSSPQCCGNWSEDGRRFVFQATREGRSEIWSIPGSNPLRHLLYLDRPRQITAAPQDFLTPTLSPDGATLYMLGQQLRGELVRYDAQEHQFLPYLGGKSLDYLEFSRDGAWITYVDYPQGTLWRSRPDGSERLQLTFAPMRVMLPHWSPDDREIVFHGLGSGSNRDYTISATGGVPRPVFEDEVMTLDWSPDGTSFVYSDFPFFSSKPEDAGVHVYNIASRQAATIAGSKGLVNPVWSPDGRYIAASKVSGGGETQVFDRSTQSWSSLVRSRGIPRWSRDSKWLFYLQGDGEPAIMKVRISDHRIEKVTDLSQIRITGGLAGVQFSLSPEDAPILLRDTGTQEIYSVTLNL